MRTTISLPDELLENAKAAAAARSVTLGTVIEDALRAHLSARRSADVPRIKLPTFSGELVDPNLDLSKTSALIAMDDEEQYGNTK